MQQRLWWRLMPLSLAEWRHHPWRHAVALLAVALGVALAASVQMINASALAEFSQAVRSVNGQPDAVLGATSLQDGFDDTVFATLATDEAVALASPLLEQDLPARREPPAASAGDARDAAAAAGAQAQREAQALPGSQRLRVVGVDLLTVGLLTPDLVPSLAISPTAAPTVAATPDGPDTAWGRLAADRVYLNAAARQQLGLEQGDSLQLLGVHGWQRFTVAGALPAGGAPLAVLDIAAAQTRLGPAGRLSRVDLRLVAGVDRERWQRQVLGAQPPPGVRWLRSEDAVQRVSNLSRAYRVNLGVLAMVALLVGGFLVYSVVSLSVAQRLPQLALLGVLGLAAADRRRLILFESALLGLLGSALGLAAGAGLAALALRLLGADLGGGYFAGVAPVLHWPWPVLAACFALGTAAAVLGAWWPARQAERLAPAMALKGLGDADGARGDASALPGGVLLALGGLLALAPPIAGLPLAAYAAVALLLAGGVVLVPVVVRWLLALPLASHQPVALLAWRRAHFARATASATVAGVVASLALSVAITVMVASFRSAVADWLQTVLPADLYVRGVGSSPLPPGLVARASALPEVRLVEAGRQRAISLAPQQPAVMLLARELGAQPAHRLPLVGDALPPQPSLPAGVVDAWISEPMVALYGWRPGQRVALPLADAPGGALQLQLRGVWRDYGRQFGAVAINRADYQRVTGDDRFNELALWLQPGSSADTVGQRLQALVAGEAALETIGTQTLRQLSLKIFDRSFAVTHYLQAVAIAVGLVGVAASLSAQVLARRKEFGLLAHLGFTRRQVMAMVAAETTAWLAAGVLTGLALGAAMAVVLVHVVNPQSFHWSMPLQWPGWRLAMLASAVLVSGMLAAAWTARRAASHHAVLAVKEDW